MADKRATAMLGNTNAAGKRTTNLAQAAAIQRKAYADMLKPRELANSIVSKSVKVEGNMFTNALATLKEDLSYAMEDVRDEANGLLDKAGDTRIGRELRKAYDGDVAQSVVQQTKGVRHLLTGAGNINNGIMRSAQENSKEINTLMANQMLPIGDKHMVVGEGIIEAVQADPLLMNYFEVGQKNIEKADVAFKAAKKATTRVSNRMSIAKNEAAVAVNTAQVYAALLPEMASLQLAKIRKRPLASAQAAIAQKTMTSESIARDVRQGKAAKKRAADLRKKMNTNKRK